MGDTYGHGEYLQCFIVQFNSGGGVNPLIPSRPAIGLSLWLVRRCGIFCQTYVILLLAETDSDNS